MKSKPKKRATRLEASRERIHKEYNTAFYFIVAIFAIISGIIICS